MAAKGHNPGFHMLEDFVCEAIHAPSIPLADPTKKGRNEGMGVLEELLVEAGKAPTPDEKDSLGSKPSPSVGPVADALQAEARRLAAIIAGSADPMGNVTQFQKLLLAEISSIQKAGTVSSEGCRPTGQGSESGGK
jgi:hypothetical protein